MLIETHAHLDFPQFDADRDEVISRARKAGIGYIINVSSSLKGCVSSVELSKKYDIIYASCGIHPHDAKDADEGAFKAIRDILVSSKKVVAIGEIGIDLFRNLSPVHVQAEVFRKFLKLSSEFNLPVVLHCREEGPDAKGASELLFGIMEEELKKPFRGVMHCFSGDEKLLKKCVDAGLHVSFTCNVTFKKADRLREVLKHVPIEKLLLETDCPYLAPQEKRGERNEPANLSYLVDAVSKNMGVKTEDVEKVTTENARRLFSF